MEKEEKEKILARIRDACIMDNAFMTAFFDNNNEAVEFVLRIILDDKGLKVIDSSVQKMVKNVYGRDVCLDVHAIAGNGDEINIEIQRSNEGASPKRARYHSAMLDSHMLPSGSSFDEIKDSYVIFITENDVLRSGESLCTIERIILNTNEIFNDGGHIIYVNGADQNSTTELGKLMHDFFCSDPDKMYYPILAKKANDLKNTKKGVKTMETYLDKYDRETAEKAQREIQIEIAMKMIAKAKNSFEDIADYTGLSIETIAELAGKVAV